MQTRIRKHIRSNVVAYVALLCFAVGGTAIAAGTKAPKNSVVSKSIKNGAVKAKDVKAAQVQLRVGDSCPAGEAIRVINVDGGVLCEADNQGGGGGRPSGPAGASLAGTYPNPTLAPNSVGTDQLADNAVTRAKLAADLQTAVLHVDADASLIGGTPGAAVKAGTTPGSYCFKLPFVPLGGSVTAGGGNHSTIPTLYVPPNLPECPDPGFRGAEILIFDNSNPPAVKPTSFFVVFQ